jgi:hypothetical protein
MIACTRIISIHNDVYDLTLKTNAWISHKCVNEYDCKHSPQVLCFRKIRDALSHVILDKAFIDLKIPDHMNTNHFISIKKEYMHTQLIKQSKFKFNDLNLVLKKELNEQKNEYTSYIKCFKSQCDGLWPPFRITYVGVHFIDDCDVPQLPQKNISQLLLCKPHDYAYYYSFSTWKIEIPNLYFLKMNAFEEITETLHLENLYWDNDSKNILDRISSNPLTCDTHKNQNGHYIHSFLIQNDQRLSEVLYTIEKIQQQ